MNFLAHFHLAWPDEGLLTGGLEGDYRKGPLRGDLPRGIERGVVLHRAIDAFTDDHPLIQQLRRQFPAHLRRYAGIVIDLCFDHYLSRHWSRFADLPLADFNRQVYHTLQTHQHELSAGARRMLQRMVEHDILTLYQDWTTVPASAARIGERFTRHNPFTELEQDLAPLRSRLEQGFLDFYPDLQDFTAGQAHRLN